MPLVIYGLRDVRTHMYAYPYKSDFKKTGRAPACGQHYLVHKVYAKQKHPRYKKSEAKSEAPVSSYSYTQLKSVIRIW